MARKTAAIANSAPSFTAASYNEAAKALVTVGHGIDKASAAAASAVSTFAIASAVGLEAKAITLDDVKNTLVNATPLARRKANVEAFAVANPGKTIGIDAIAACGAAVKGWYYSISRVAKDGNLALLINGTSLSAARDGSKAAQSQSKGKRAATTSKDVNDDTTANDVKAIAVPSAALGNLDDAMNALATRIAAASAKVLRQGKMQKELANLAAVVAKAVAMIEAAERNAPTVKATRKPRAKKAAANVVAIAA